MTWTQSSTFVPGRLQFIKRELHLPLFVCRALLSPASVDMASAICKNQPPKARKRIVVGLPTKQGTANGSIITSTCETCNKDIPVSAAGIDAHDCKKDSNKASSVLAEPALTASTTKAADAAKAMSTETDNKRIRKRKIVGDAVELPSKSVKAKKEKDPNEPKRPPTPFFLFMEEFRPAYKKANPNAKGGASISKGGGEKWKSMSDEAKEPYVKKSNDMKVEYQKALKMYKSNGKELIESTITDNAEEKCDVDVESCQETAASADYTILDVEQ